MQVVFRFAPAFYDYWNRRVHGNRNWSKIAHHTKLDDMFAGELSDNPVNNSIEPTDDRLLDLWEDGTIGTISPRHYIILTPRDIVKIRLSNGSNI
jgi:hypothetical protein